MAAVIIIAVWMKNDPHKKLWTLLKSLTSAGCAQVMSPKDVRLYQSSY